MSRLAATAFAGHNSSMILLLGALAVQDGVSLEPLYKFKPGTSWTYKRLENGVERRIEARALEDVEGRVKLDWRELNLDGTLYKKSTVTFFVKDGVLRAEARGGDDEGAFELPILKGGLKKDEGWSNPEGEAMYLGASELKVPAGTYPDAHHARLNVGTADAPAHIDFHLVPKVGVVKIAVASTEGPNSFELTEFKDAK